MFDPFSAISNVVGTLASLIGDLKRAKRDRRDRVAEYFQSVSLCLDAIAQAMRAAIVNDARGGAAIPHSACAELNAYAEDLPRAVGAEIGDARADQLADQLRDAAADRALIVRYLELSRIAKTDGGRELDAAIVELEKSAGQLRALAVSLRAS
jgi:hypothetical protein